MPTTYMEIFAVQPPIDVGMEDSTLRRAIYSVNFTFHAATESDQFEKEVAKYIHNNNLGIWSNTSPLPTNVTVFIGSKSQIPDGDGPYILIKSTGGRKSDFTHDDLELENLSCQILIYASDPSAGRNRAYAIWRLFNGKRNLELSAA